MTATPLPLPEGVLDLRKTKCPLNFVKAKLALEKRAVGETLTLWVWADADSALNLPASFAAEGHTVTQGDSFQASDSLQTVRVLHITRSTPPLKETL